MQTLIENATLYALDGRHEPAWLLVSGTRIAALGWGARPAPSAERVIDAGGQALVPGLIDIHVHGALGHDTMDATPDALRAMAAFYARHGVTGFLATTMTAPSEAINAALENIAGVMRAGTGGAALLGAHVEGPYVDVARRGAQAATHVRSAEEGEYGRYFASGVVRLLTLAPELPQNAPLIRYAIEHGAAVAAGHTRADYDAMRHAADLGVTQVTHLFNGMEPLHHRTPGAVGAALTLDALACQLIADNIHVHPAMLKLAVRAKGVGRIILVTDAMSGTGMPDGQYELGGQPVTVRGGEARITVAEGFEAGPLAGSTLTLERGVAHIMAAASLSLEEALPMATSVPARALGLERHKGALAVGLDADLALWDAAGRVTLTMVGGEIVHRD